MLFCSCSHADTSWEYNYIADAVHLKMCQVGKTFSCCKSRKKTTSLAKPYLIQPPTKKTSSSNSKNFI